ncbi:hypothetical protein EJB05_13602, partial [Eragrostis curvula]
MQYLFVRVVKARKLPDVDAYGSLDPYVEVTFGDNNFGFTKCVKRNKNPEWNETFAFPFEHGKAPTDGVDVKVYDKDLVKNDLVGKLHFDVVDIPQRSPYDIPLEPTWHELLDGDGKSSAHPSLLVAIWIGSQADEAYRHAWASRYIPKVYESPRLWCLRITIFEAQGITVTGGNAGITEVFCKASLGNQIKMTRPVKMQMTTSTCIWNEDLVLVAAEPFFEGDLVVSVIAGPGKGEVIGQLTVPLASIDKHGDDNQFVTPDWIPLESPTAPQFHGCVDDGSGNSQMKICLRKLLDGRYHIGPDTECCIDDPRPADRRLWSPRIGSVDLGILRVIGLKERDGNSPLNKYCVPKYGKKWVRTRTVIDGRDHVFNEQYTWDVYDLATVLNVAVFEQCAKQDSGHREIGKVRIHLSHLETDRVYAHSYPLVTLLSSGAVKTGELQLAVKISVLSSTNMLFRYARPILPSIHYVEPLAHTEQADLFVEREIEEDKLRSQAAEILALRLGRMEPPLRSEVVAFMCKTGVNSMYSLRKMKLCVALLAVRNYRRRPTGPPHIDYNLSHLGNLHPDELDEEFDTVKSRCDNDGLLRMRYDRLRSIAGRVQTVVGDVATEGERFRSLVSWRDPRATVIFEFFMLVAAAVAYLVPFKGAIAKEPYPQCRPYVFQNDGSAIPGGDR